MEEENRKIWNLQNIISWIIGIPVTLLLISVVLPYEFLVTTISLSIIGGCLYICCFVIRFVWRFVVMMIKKFF